MINIFGDNKKYLAHHKIQYFVCTGSEGVCVDIYSIFLFRNIKMVILVPFSGCPGQVVGASDCKPQQCKV